MSDAPDAPTAPGWYPQGEGERWWDGRGWTEYTRPAGGEAGAAALPPQAPATGGPRPPRSRLAVAALVLGIVAVVLAAAVRILPIVGLLPGLVALVLGIVVLARREAGRGFAIAGVVLGALVLLSTAGNVASRAYQAAAPEPTADAAAEHQYLETAIDALTQGLQGTTLTGTARQEAHQKADAQLLSTGYQTCRALNTSTQTPAEFADQFVKSFTGSGGSDSAARKVGRRLIPAIGTYLCPDHRAELQEAARDL